MLGPLFESAHSLKRPPHLKPWMQVPKVLLNGNCMLVFRKAQVASEE